MITMASALKEMESIDSKGLRIPFTVTYLTANRENYRKWQKLNKQLEHLKKNSDEFKAIKAAMDKIDIGGRPVTLIRCIMTGRPKSPAKAVIQAAEKTGTVITNPRHWANKTRNFKLPNNEIRKAHIRLIMEFNKETVIY